MSDIFETIAAILHALLVQWGGFQVEVPGNPSLLANALTTGGGTQFRSADIHSPIHLATDQRAMKPRSTSKDAGPGSGSSVSEVDSEHEDEPSAREFLNPAIKVAWVAPSLERGWRWQALLKELSRIYPQTVVFTGRWPGFTQGFENAFEVRDLRKYRFIRVPWSDPDAFHGFAWVSPLILWDLVRFRPDIIVTNGFHLCSLYALIVKWLLGSRVVLIWQGVSAETGGTPGSLRLKVRRAMARFFDLAVCNTREGSDYLTGLVKMPLEKVVHFVGEVADRHCFPTRNETLKPFESLKRPLFLFVGRMIRGKGVEKLLEACAILIRRGLRDFSVALVGEGRDREYFRRLASRLGIAPWTTWKGFVPYERLGPIYEASDVFVLPSLEDTWGVVVAEAMCFGKPVICSVQAGSSELVEEGRNGFVFNPYAPQELATYMARFIRDPELIAKLGSNAQAKAANLTPRRAARRFAFLLAKCAGYDAPQGFSETIHTVN
ncbi:MAG: glycosyltransferase family 4 protein [Terriglobia bacterium]